MASAIIAQGLMYTYSHGAIPCAGCVCTGPEASSLHGKSASPRLCAQM